GPGIAHTRGVDLLAVRPVVVEKEVLRNSMGQRLFGNLVARIVLTGAQLHRLQLRERGVAGRRVRRAMSRDELLQQVGPLQDDAAAGVLRRRLAEIAQKSRLLKDLPQRSLVVNRFLGELNDGARLDITPGA